MFCPYHLPPQRAREHVHHGPTLRDRDGAVLGMACWKLGRHARISRRHVSCLAFFSAHSTDRARETSHILTLAHPRTCLTPSSYHLIIIIDFINEVMNITSFNTSCILPLIRVHTLIFKLRLHRFECGAGIPPRILRTCHTTTAWPCTQTTSKSSGEAVSACMIF